MKFLDLTLATPAENLALDEALLDGAEENEGPGSVLRVWESPQPFVVLGRSSRVAVEVNREACRQASIPVLRRCSGGAAVVAGPGCLMYAVVLSYRDQPRLRMINQAHRFVLAKVGAALSTICPGVEMQGTSDLTWQNRKFSGNSLRCKRDHLLYHGTILYDFPLELIDRCLGTPPRQPDYRRARAHLTFVDNFPAGTEQLQAALRDVWSATEPLDRWPRERVCELVQQRYSRDSWHFRI